MFGALFRGLKKAGMAGEVMNLLLRNYHLEADVDRVNHYIQSMGDLCQNPHELAIGYLGVQASFMQRGNSEHERLAKKYVRVAKQAYAAGAASDPWALSELENSIRKQLGLDTSRITAEG
jgi:hypothetical protein